MNTCRKTLAISSIVLNLIGCSSQPNGAQKIKDIENHTINITALKGPTGMGLLRLMEKGETKNTYKISIEGDPGQVLARFLSGDSDVVALPSNMASIIYNKTRGDIQVAAVNTLGALYIVSRYKSINTLKDLIGKTIYVSGEGSTPQYILNHILMQWGIDIKRDITIDYKQEHAQLASLMIAGEVDIAMLPEPFVTQVVERSRDIVVNIDLTKEWDKLSNGESGLTTGCIIAKRSYVNENKEAFRAFLCEYKASAEYVNTNISEAAILAEKYEIMPYEIAMQAIPKSNIVFIEGEEMRKKLRGFLEVLYNSNKDSIGGEMPGEDFYY